MTATKSITLRAAAAFLISGLPALASADEVALACTIRSIPPSPDGDPYVFPVVIDPERRAVISVNNDDASSINSDWITDRFSETMIAAHFAEPTLTGTIKLDRVTGVVDVETMEKLSGRTIAGGHGICELSKMKF